MLTFLALGSAASLILLGLLFIVLIISTETDSPFWGLTSILVVLLALWFLGSRAELQAGMSFIYHNPIVLLLGFIAYMVIGTVWSFYKWYLMLLREKERKGERLNNYTTSGGNLSLPKVSENKALIINWIFYWPFSVIWFVINDPFRRLGNWIIQSFSGAYNRIVDNVFKDVIDKHEFKKMEEERIKQEKLNPSDKYTQSSSFNAG